jgi:hypothetical protein
MEKRVGYKGMKGEEQGRTYARTKVRVPFKARFLDQDDIEREIEIICSGLGRGNAEFKEVKNIRRVLKEKYKIQTTREESMFIIDMLTAIWMRLDRIEKHLGTVPPMECDFEGATYDISGSGFSFYHSEKIEKDTLFYVFMELPLFPKNGIEAVVRVTRSTKEEDQWLIGVSFDFIREDDREDLIKFTFMKAREILARGGKDSH